MAQKSVIAHRLLPLMTLVLFAAALWILHDILNQYHYHQIVAQLRATPPAHVVTALGLTVSSYLILTGYDRLAIAYLQHPLPLGRVTLASFVSYAFSNNLGLSLLTGGSIRYRLYSAWGFSAEEIARLVTFTMLTFWLGIATVGSLVFFIEPLSLPVLEHLSTHSTRPIALLFAALVAGYLLTVSFRKAPFRFGNWDLPIPSLRLAGTQLLVGALDWLLAGSVLFVLLPEHSEFSFFQFLAIYLLAQVVVLISNVPGGLGVFESMILLSAPGIPADALLGSMLIYRGIYYLLPLTLAALLLGGNELLQKRCRITKAIHLVGRWGRVMVPQLLAATTLVSGTILLFSGATPAAPHRLHWLKEIMPLPVIELSHFFGSLVGVCLLLLARGLQRRLNAAYVLTAFLLAAGSLLSLLKGADYEEAMLLGLMLAALLPCRNHFYRHASLFSEFFSPGWSVTVLLVLVSSFGLGIFAYKHVPYSNELWWEFAIKGDAPRFLRAAVGTTVLLLLVAMSRLMRPAKVVPSLPQEAELDKARQVIARLPSTIANLALLGDKALLFNKQSTAFIMYSIAGRSWIVMSDPAGPSEAGVELAWEFRERVEQQGGAAGFL